MQDSSEHSEVLRNIPLIPLRDLVVFPATLVPFIIGRSSSVQALEKAAEAVITLLGEGVEAAMNRFNSQ